MLRPPPSPLVMRRSRLHLVVPRSAPPIDVGPIESGALLNGSREVLIRHGGELYRLRHTRNDKLILTK